MSKSVVVLRSVNEQSVETIVNEVFSAFGQTTLVPQDSKVVIKVNLSTPFKEMAPASNTSPEILDAVCKILKEKTDFVVVGESDGMRYKSEDAFEVSGYYPILQKYGVRPMNFSKDEWIEVNRPLIKGWGLPRTLLEADVFITLPVLKTHATTVFTGALKNQFGCFPQYNRLLLHPHLDEVLVLVNQILKPKLAIMDAIIAMEGRGPINGKPRRLDIVLASTDPVALDATAMRLVGLDPFSSRHLTIAAGLGLGRVKEEEIVVNGDFEKYRTVFEPAERDLPIRLLALLSHSRFFSEKLILNPEAFAFLKGIALSWRETRDSIIKRLRSREG